MSDETPPPPPPEPQMPAPPPSAPPPGYYEQGSAPSAAWGAPPGDSTTPAQWHNLRGLTNALTVLFAIHIGLAVLLIIGVINHLSVLSDNEVGGIVLNTDEVNDAQAFPVAMLLLAFFLGIATLVLLIIWLFRAAKNNEALGRQNPRLGPGWAIAGLLIPFANLVIPFIMFDDVWRGSDPAVPRGDPNWRRSSTLPAIWAWLVTSVIFTIPNLVASAGGDVRADEPEKVRRDDILRIIATVGAILAAVFAIVVIRRLAARQEACLQAQQNAASAPSAPPS
jgi:uncharacterized BrkB/YihY/UPF0761 family membrane protein